MTETPEEAHEERSGSFVDRLIWTIQSPIRLFADIDEGAPWWQPWVWVSLLSMAIAYVSMPIQLQLVRLNPSGVPEDQLRETLEGLEKLGFLNLISAPVAVLLMSVIFSGVSYLVLSLLAEEPNFKKYFTLYLYSSIVLSIGMLLGSLVTRMRGVENIRSVEDAIASFGPAMLLEPDQKMLHSVLASLDVFYIWFYILMAMGVMYIFRLSLRWAILVVIPVWLLFVLSSLIGSRMSASA